MTADASLNAADSRHPLLDQLEQLWRNKTAVAGLVIVIAFVLTAICAPLLSPCLLYTSDAADDRT